MGSVNNVSVGLTQAQIDALGELLYAENLIGIIDGVNVVYTTTHSYQVGRIWVYKNGQQLVSPDDFVESNDKEVTLTFPPQLGDVLFVQYTRQAL